MRIPTILCLAFTACCLLTPVAAQAQELDRLVPPDSIFFLRIENLDRTRERFKQSPLHALWSDEAVTKFVAKPLEQWSKFITEQKDEYGVTLEDVVEVISGSLSIAVTSFEMGAEADGGALDVQMVGMAEFGENADRARELIEKIEEADSEKLRRFEEEFRGVTIVYHLPREGEGEDGEAPTEPDACYVLDGATFYVASSLDSMRKLIAMRETEDAAVLADNEVYRKVCARTGEKADLLAYVAAQPMMAGFAKQFAEGFAEGSGVAPEEEAGASEFRRILDALGLGAAEGAAFQARIGREGVEARMFLSSPGPKAGIMKFFSGANSALTLPAFVPEDIIQASTLILDIEGIWAEVYKVAEAMQPGSTQMMKMGVEQMKASTGIDFEADVIGSLGKEVTWYVRSNPDAPGLDFGGGGAVPSLPMAVVTVELTDKDKMEGVLNIAQMLSGGAMQVEEYIGWRIRTIQAGLPMTPAIALLPGRLAFAMNVEDLRDIIRRQGKEVKGANEMPGLARAMEYVPANRIMLSIAHEAKALHQSAIMNSLNMAGGENEVVDMALFPSEEVLTKYLGVGVTSMTNEEDGVSYVYFLSFPTNDSEDEDE